MTNIDQETQELTICEIDETTTLNIPAKVILFNDDVHTFEDVIFQLMKAINCTMEQGEAFAWEVHTRGKAIVFNGDLSECLKVSSVLEEIDLGTQIEY